MHFEVIVQVRYNNRNYSKYHTQEQKEKEKKTVPAMFGFLKTNTTTHNSFMRIYINKSIGYCPGKGCGTEALVYGDVCWGQAADNLPTRPIGWLFSRCCSDVRLLAIVIQLAIIHL